MAKRFTDTNKYKKPFIRSLKGAYKLLWDYLYHDCDHAGIWIVDFDIAQIYIGQDMPVTKEDALRYFNNDETRIVEFNNSTKWFIPSFIEFQYGKLNENNRAHNSVIQILKKNNLYNFKPLTSPLQGGKDMDKEMVKDMDMDKEKKGEIHNVNHNTEYSEFIERFHSEQWFEEIAMRYKTSTEIVEQLAIEFEKDRKLDGSYTEKSITELKNWFVNTVNLKKNTAPKSETREEKANRLIKLAKLSKHGN